MSEYAYIAIRRCGCVTAIVVEDMETEAERDDLADDLATFIRSDRIVERLPVEEAKRRITFDCPHAVHA